MAKIQTVNQLISVFKDIATRHYQINGFGIGDDWENGASEEKMHPVLWINPVTASMPESESTGYKTFEIDFEVRVFDLVSKGESNENDVLSDCIDILKDIILEFKGHPYYVNSQLNIIDDISFEAFTEEFDEDVSGWVCELSLMTPILNSFCGIPAADITGFEFPGIDCPDVNVLCPVFVEDVTGVYPIVVTTVGTTKEVSIAGVGSDTFVVSGVYDTGTLTLTRNDAVDVVVTGFASGGDNDYTTAATLTGNIITFDRTDTVGAYSVDLTSAINSAPDKFVSSGAYDEPNNKIVLTLNDASTVDIDTSAIGGGDSIYTADDTIGAGRVATLTDSLTFKDGTVSVQGIGTAGSSALAIYDNDTTPNKLWDFLDNGNVNLGGDSTVNLGSNDLEITGNRNILLLKSTNTLLGYTDASLNLVNYLNMNVLDVQFGINADFEVKNINGSQIPLLINASSNYQLKLEAIGITLGDTNNAIYNNSGSYGLTRGGTYRQRVKDALTVICGNRTLITNNAYTESFIGTEDISLQGDTLLNAKVSMPNLPTSATGLTTGDLWNDGGTLKIA